MSEGSVIGLALAKQVFQVHGADAAGRVVLRKTLRRAQVLEFFGHQPRCVVAMEACGGAHVWGREIGRLGHKVRLIPPTYVIAAVGDDVGELDGLPEGEVVRQEDSDTVTLTPDEWLVWSAVELPPSGARCGPRLRPWPNCAESRSERSRSGSGPRAAHTLPEDAQGPSGAPPGSRVSLSDV